MWFTAFPGTQYAHYPPSLVPDSERSQYAPLVEHQYPVRGVNRWVRSDYVIKKSLYNNQLSDLLDSVHRHTHFPLPTLNQHAPPWADIARRWFVKLHGGVTM